MSDTDTSRGHSTLSWRRPNVMLVLLDDMGFSDLGCYGGEIRTPNVDGLAENGIRFSQFYNTGRCWPTRSSILTGCYAPQVCMDPPDPDRYRPSWQRLIPHYLRNVGYRRNDRQSSTVLRPAFGRPASEFSFRLSSFDGT